MREQDYIDAEFRVVSDQAQDTDAANRTDAPAWLTYLVTGAWLAFSVWAFPRVQAFFDALYWG